LIPYPQLGFSYGEKAKVVLFERFKITILSLLQPVEKVCILKNP
jgi:hypothetical protein